MIPRRPIVFVVLLCLCFVATSVKASLPTNGLVAYYPFDGNANDASGNGLNGTAFSTTEATNRFGEVGKALWFDGVQSFVDLGNRPEFSFSGSFSIGVWVKLSGDQSTKYIVAKYDFGNATNAYGMGTADFSRSYAFLKGDAATYQDTSGGPTLADDKWHFLAMVYDDTAGLSLYVDGGRVGFVQHTGYAPFADATPLLVGKTFSGQQFGGAIDDLRVYNRALTAEEIADMGPAPEISIGVSPRSGYSTAGARMTLRVFATATGPFPVTYQWFKNGEPVGGATGTSLVVTNDTAGSDVYKVQIKAGPTTVFTEEATATFAAPEPAGLLAHYTFETGGPDTIVDETGRFPGQGVNTEYVPGRVGSRALRFNGTNAFVRIPFPASPLDLAGTAYTIAFWIKPETRASSQAAIWMGDGAADVGGYSFTFVNTSGTWNHNSGTDNPLLFSFRPQTNWVHVALVFNGFARVTYFNGAVSNQVTTANAIVSERDDDLYLGARNGTNSFLRGSLDDVRIYNYALASDEIQQLSSITSGAPLNIVQRATDLLLRWTYDPTVNYRLEYASDLGPNAAWTPVSGVPQRVGDLYTLAQPFDANARFYRLRKL